MKTLKDLDIDGKMEGTNHTTGDSVCIKFTPKGGAKNFAKLEGFVKDN